MFDIFFRFSLTGMLVFMIVVFVLHIDLRLLLGWGFSPYPAPLVARELNGEG